MKRIFISFPYTHENVGVTHDRILLARKYCLELIKAGDCPFSPATFGHDLMYQLGLKPDEMDLSFKYWEELCYAYLEPCDEMHVLMLDGWDKSTGVSGEILKATLLKKNIRYIKYDYITQTFSLDE